MTMQLPHLLNGLLPQQAAQSVPNVSISAIADDSRQVQAGGLFIALAGFGGQHGLHFAEQAVAAGAVAIIWEPSDNAPELPTLDCAAVFAIPNLQHCYGVIAARFYGQPSAEMAVVGITGTDGKTSCAWMLTQAWSALGLQAAMLGTLGKGQLGQLQRGAFTTPFPVELQQSLAAFRSQSVTQVAMEVSSHALDQGRVAATKFDVAVLTNLSRDHLDYHQTEAAYAAAKQRLFTDYAPRAAVVNTDDEFGRQLLNNTNAATLSYGLGVADVSAKSISQHGGIGFELHYQQQCETVSTQLIGDFNVYNLLAVAAVLLQQGVALADIAAALAQIKAPPGRLELFQTKHQQVVVDYAHTPNALAVALKALRSRYAGRIHCLFGCGGDRDKGKRALMAEAAEQYADVVSVTDDNPRSESAAEIFADIRGGFNKPSAVTFEHDRATAIRQAIAGLNQDDVLLVAGKGHEDYQLLGYERRHFSDREEVANCLGLPKPEVLYAE